MRAFCFLLLTACAGGEDVFPTNTGGDDTGDPGGEDCPPGMTLVTGNFLNLGEWSQDERTAYARFVLPLGETTVSDFCMATLPFPGAEGDPWPTDGLTHERAEALDSLLPQWGLRFCTITELEYAAAGDDNWRYPYSKESFESGTCEVDDFNPGPIGSYPDCVSPKGIRDFQVRSTWGTMDAVATAHMADAYSEDGFPGGGTYGVWGGTSRQDTFYAPGNFGLHFHGPGEAEYLDDHWRPCADPGTYQVDQHLDWVDWVDLFREHNSWAYVLAGAG